MPKKTFVRYVMLILLGVLSYVSLLIKYLMNMWKIGKAVEQFPMDKKHWFRGHNDEFFKDGGPFACLRRLVENYPKAHGIYFTNFFRPYVVVHHPETIKAVMRANCSKALSLGFYKYATLLFGNESLFLRSGPKWFRNRRLLTPMFFFEMLKTYVHFNNQATDIFLTKLSKAIKINPSVEIRSFLAPLTYDIISRCAFSTHSDVQYDEEISVIKAADVATELLFKRNFEPFNHVDFIYFLTKDGKEFKRCSQVIRDISSQRIDERKKLIEKCPLEIGSYHDFLDLLIMSKDEDGNGLTQEEMIAEVNVFTIAGFETVNNTASWTLFNLASYPHHQKKCQEEIDNLMTDRSDDHLTWNDLQTLPYITMCIKESMRLHGIPFIERRLEEDIIIDGKMVLSGTTIFINLYNLHRNPAVWDDPDKFDPERFSEENICKRDAYAFIPFSAGARNCIGQAFAYEEIKIIVARTLYRFSFTVKDNHVPEKIFALTLKSKNGFQLLATERKSKEL